MQYVIHYGGYGDTKDFRDERLRELEKLRTE